MAGPTLRQYLAADIAARLGYTPANAADMQAITDLVVEGSEVLSQQIEDLNTGMAQAGDLQDQWSIGMPATFKFDASQDIGTTPVRILGADDSRVALWLYNADSDGGTITFITEAGTPVYGEAGTANLAPGASASWSASECPDGEIWAVADQEGTALTCKYSSTTNSPPGLLEVFARMTSTPDTTRKGHLRTLWNACLAAGIDIAEMEYFAVIGHTEQASLLNWPGGTMTKSGAPTFDADDYFQGDGVDDCIDTGVDLPGGGYTQNSNMLAVFASHPTGNLGTSQYILAHSSSGIISHRSSNTFGVRHQGTTTSITPGGAMPADEFIAVVRSNSADFKVWLNDTYSNTFTQASASASPTSLYLMSLNGSGSFSAARWLASIAGPAPADPDTAIPALRAALIVYLTAIGAI